MYSKKAYAKVNIFLKIAGKTENGYHKLVSRFCRVKNLYDTIDFKKTDPGRFELSGDFGCDMQSNTIYKVYKKLLAQNPSVEEFFKQYSIKVDKKIPEFAGLGGGSSDAATFLLMCNDILNLGLSKDDLANIGKSVGADIPFFIYEYDSANVTGFGEKVEKFDEPVLDLEVYTPSVKCDTKEVFNNFSNDFYKEIDKEKADKLLNMKSIDIFKELTIEEANDLYFPAIKSYKKLQKVTYPKKNKKYFFSGSGSSFVTFGG